MTKRTYLWQLDNYDVPQDVDCKIIELAILAKSQADF